jgi:hypothetical protein
MVVTSNKKLNSVRTYSNNKSKFHQSSKIMIKLIQFQLHVVEVSKVLSTDGMLQNYQERQEEVLEKLLVLVLGIQLMYITQSPELVNKVTSTELKQTN